MTTDVKTPRKVRILFPSILHVFYGILTLFCITFDALQMHLIVTDVVVTLTANLYHLLHFTSPNVLQLQTYTLVYISLYKFTSYINDGQLSQVGKLRTHQNMRSA